MPNRYACVLAPVCHAHISCLSSGSKPYNKGDFWKRRKSPDVDVVNESEIGRTPLSRRRRYQVVGSNFFTRTQQFGAMPN